MFVFNHIPKCGGTSFRAFLASLLTVHLDYAPEGAVNNPVALQGHRDAAYRLEQMGERDCIAGHYNIPGLFLEERYPGVFERARVFSILRDPFEAAVSAVRYGERRGVIAQAGPERQTRRLLKRAGSLSKILGVERREAIESVLDRYWFVAPLDRIEDAARIIERAAGARGGPVPVLNAAPAPVEGFLPEAEALFREAAELDMAVYEAVRTRFEFQFSAR